MHIDTKSTSDCGVVAAAAAEESHCSFEVAQWSLELFGSEVVF